MSTISLTSATLPLGSLGNVFARIGKAWAARRDRAAFAGMSEREFQDIGWGQMDRQPENIFIQIDGNKAKVTGIDNDMCMGKKLTHLDALDTGSLREDLKKTYGGPPPLMSRGGGHP